MLSKIIYISILLIIFITFGLKIFIENGNSINNNYLDSFTAIDLSTESIVDKNIFHDNYVVLKIFASWCKVCDEEAKLFTTKFNKNVTLYGINVFDEINNAKSWVESHNINNKIIYDKYGIIAKKLNINGAPETILLNPKGKILYRHEGNMTDKDLLELNLIIDTETSNA